MTTVSTIITDAYRQSNLIAIGTLPTAHQQEEALRYLNRLVLSVYGNEVGDPLTPFPLGQGHINRPQGYPWYGDSPPAQWFVPLNTRLVCNILGPTVVFLHPIPQDGAGLAINDVQGNFDVAPLVLKGNGRLIDGGFEYLCSTPFEVRQFFFRGDLGSWVTVSPLTTLEQLFPFPPEFDMYFITLLALALNPMYGVEMNQQVQVMMQRSAKQFRARYHNVIPVRSELGLIRMPLTSQERSVWWNNWNSGWNVTPTATFNAGIPF